MRKIRFGVIGCGAIAVMKHLPALKKSKFAQLTAVVDTDAAHLTKVQREFAAKYAFGEIEKLAGVVDAVIVATPNSTHFGMTKVLLEAGLHVLCDKPLALTTEEAEQLYRIAQEAKLKLMVGYSRRFTTRIRTLHKFLETNHSTFDIRISLGGNMGDWPARSNFRSSKSLSGGGCIVDTGVHIVDMAIHFLGTDVVLKESKLERLELSEVEDNARIVLQFSSGSTATLSCSYLYALKPEIKVFWSGGWAHTMLDGTTEIISWHNRDSLVCRAAGVQQIVVELNDPFFDQIEHFSQCILSDTIPTIKMEEVIANQKIIDKIYSHEAK